MIATGGNYNTGGTTDTNNVTTGSSNFFRYRGEWYESIATNGCGPPFFNPKDFEPRKPPPWFRLLDDIPPYPLPRKCALRASRGHIGGVFRPIRLPGAHRDRRRRARQRYLLSLRQSWYN